LVQTGVVAPDSSIIPSMLGGLSATATYGPNFLNLPSAVEIGVSDLLQGDLLICNNIVNSAYYTFKNTKPFGLVNAANYELVDEIVESSAFVSGQGGYKDMTRCAGACAILVWVEGLPPSTTPIIQIEHIIHLEGSPTLPANGSTGNIVPSGASSACVGSTAIVEAAIGKLALNSVKYLARNSNFIKSFAGMLI